MAGRNACPTRPRHDRQSRPLVPRRRPRYPHTERRPPNPRPTMHPPVDDDLDPALDRAAATLRGARRVAVLTGAGVSAESGVPTFRDADGLWEGHPVEEVATPRAFRRDPRLVWQFYNARRANLRAVEP